MARIALRLHAAIVRHDFHAMKELVDAGFPLDQKNSYGETPLQLALLCGSKKMVRYLYKKGAPLLPDDGNSMLHYAAVSGSMSLCRFLVNSGFLWCLHNDAGETPSDVAHYNGYEILSEYLYSLNAVVNRKSAA